MVFIYPGPMRWWYNFAFRAISGTLNIFGKGRPISRWVDLLFLRQKRDPEKRI